MCWRRQRKLPGKCGMFTLQSERGFFLACHHQLLNTCLKEAEWFSSASVWTHQWACHCHWGKTALVSSMVKLSKIFHSPKKLRSWHTVRAALISCWEKWFCPHKWNFQAWKGSNQLREKSLGKIISWRTGLVFWSALFWMSEVTQKMLQIKANTKHAAFCYSSRRCNQVNLLESAYAWKCIYSGLSAQGFWCYFFNVIYNEKYISTI